MDVGEKIHQSQQNLMKSSAHHSGERVGLVVVCDMGKGSDMDRARKDWGKRGEWYFEKNGGGGYRLTLGSKSQSQTAGLGTGLLPNIYLRRCWESSAHTPLPLPGIIPGLPPFLLPFFLRHSSLILEASLCLLWTFLSRSRSNLPSFNPIYYFL